MGMRFCLFSSFSHCCRWCLIALPLRCTCRWSTHKHEIPCSRLPSSTWTMRFRCFQAILVPSPHCGYKWCLHGFISCQAFRLLELAWILLQGLGLNFNIRSSNSYCQFLCRRDLDETIRCCTKDPCETVVPSQSTRWRWCNLWYCFLSRAANCGRDSSTRGLQNNIDEQR